MKISSRTTFEDPEWRDWLAQFPDFGSDGNGPPSAIFLSEVRRHLERSDYIALPSEKDYEAIKMELSDHFAMIAVRLRKKTDLGLVTAATGLLGLVGDFVLPGTSIAVQWICGALIVGGAASKASSSNEVRQVAAAEEAVCDWLKGL